MVASFYGCHLVFVSLVWKLIFVGFSNFLAISTQTEHFDSCHFHVLLSFATEFSSLFSVHTCYLSSIFHNFCGYSCILLIFFVIIYVLRPFYVLFQRILQVFCRNVLSCLGKFLLFTGANTLRMAWSRGHSDLRHLKHWFPGFYWVYSL